MLAEERLWFADDEAKLLGTALFDKFDKDWNYVILALESDGFYRFADIKISIETKKECQLEPKTAIQQIVRNGILQKRYLSLTQENYN